MDIWNKEVTKWEPRDKEQGGNQEGPARSNGELGLRLCA